MTEFGKMNERGEVTMIGTVPQSRMLACPNFIIDFGHYQGTDRCRCFDRSADEMSEWEYSWDETLGRWA